MREQTISERCADFIQGVRYEDLPDPVGSMAKNCLIDYLACTMGGSCMPEAEIITEFIAENKEWGKATVIGDWAQNSVLNASMANGYNFHILEYDDVHKASVIHPAAPVISAALAVAEGEQRSGKQLIEAITAGYEILFRVGEALTPSHYYSFHTTGTCGGFGAAAAAGKLLGLDQEQLVNALGNAGTQAAGLWEFLEDNAMSKYLHCGRAAASGVLSAYLAQKGFTGARRILEGKKGLVAAMSKETNPEEKFATLGQGYKILETSFKPYASCRHTHSTIDASLKLREDYGTPGREVEKIIVQIYEVATQKAKHNKSYKEPRAARFSLAFCTAAALYYGEVTPHIFTPEYMENKALLDLAAKVEIRVDDEFTQRYPEEWPSRVTLCTDSGKQYTETVYFPKGDPMTPFVDQDFERKFLNLSKGALGEKESLLLLGRCRALEDMENIAELFSF